MLSRDPVGAGDTREAMGLERRGQTGGCLDGPSWLASLPSEL